MTGEEIAKYSPCFSSLCLPIDASEVDPDRQNRPQCARAPRGSGAIHCCKYGAKQPTLWTRWTELMFQFIDNNATIPCNNRTLKIEYREKLGLLPDVSQQEETMNKQSRKSKTKRRGHNEGSIQPTQNGTWRVWVTLNSGRRVSKTLPTKPKPAIGCSKDFQKRKRHLNLSSTFGEYILEWFENHSSQLKESTQCDYELHHTQIHSASVRTMLF